MNCLYVHAAHSRLWNRTEADFRADRDFLIRVQDASTQTRAYVLANAVGARSEEYFKFDELLVGVGTFYLFNKWQERDVVGFFFFSGLFKFEWHL